MKNTVILLFILLAGSNYTFSQVTQDSLNVNNIYAPNNFNNSFSAEESWEIHKAAYIKQLKSKGLTDDEIKRSLLTYEKDKEEFIAQVKEQQKLAEIQRRKADEQRKLAEIQRKKAEVQRKQADIQRQYADAERKKADVQRKYADELRNQADAQTKEDTKLREEAEELRKKANVQRQYAEEQRKEAEEQRKLADIQRAKAEKQREKADEWRNSFESILTKNITLSNQPISEKKINFKIDKKTTLHFGIRANLSSGSTLIEIYNPNGTKEGELLLELKAKSNLERGSETSQSTSGALDKTIVNSEVGDWYIKISSKDSEGSIAISVAQQIKSSFDE